MLDLTQALEGFNIRTAHRHGNRKLPCPQCSPGRKKKQDPCLSLSFKDDGFVFKCHNAGCGFQGGWNPKQGTKGDKPYRKIPRPTYADSGLPKQAKDWLAHRKITEEAVKKNGLYWNPEKNALAFPYTSEGEILAVKYRRLNPKQFSQEPGCRRIFYGLDQLEKGKPIIFVEGEMDKLAAESAGLTNVLSVPDGGGNKDVNPYVDHAAEWLADAPSYVLALDDDEPGKEMAQSLMQRLGQHKCRLADMPAKDLNDVLLQFGADEVRDVIDKAEFCDIPNTWGDREIVEATMHLIRHGYKPGHSTGWSSLDKHWTIGESGLTVITGYPNQGKSEFLDAMAQNLMVSQSWKFGVFSPENHSPQQMIKYIEKLAKQPVAKEYPRAMNPDDARDYAEQLSLFLKFMRFDEMPTIEQILQLAEAYVLRYRIRGLIIDPYNEIRWAEGVRTETEFVSAMLSKIKAFAKNYNVHVFLVAHPKKPENGKNPSPPTLADISGSMHFCNKADNGLAVHRNENDTVSIFVRKVRDKNHGSAGGMTTLSYDKATGRYSEIYSQSTGC